MLRHHQLCKRTLILGAIAMAGVLGVTTNAFAQGGGQGGGGQFSGGQGGGLSGQGGSFSGNTSAGGSKSYLGARAGFRPSWITSTSTRTTGGQFGQAGGQFGQAGGQFGQGGGQFGQLGGRTGTSTVPRVTGAMVQDSMKPLPPAVKEIRTRLEKLLAVSTGSDGPREITFDLVGDVLVMRGDVPTEQERRLAESLLLLEPGVREVKNELTVAGRAPPKPPPKTPAGGP